LHLAFPTLSSSVVLQFAIASSVVLQSPIASSVVPLAPTSLVLLSYAFLLRVLSGTLGATPSAPLNPAHHFQAHR